jgi:hypothetical protein
MAANPQAQPQTALDELVVDDELLEKALETRERARLKALDARKAYTKANDAARAHLERHELVADRPLRVGRFVVTLAELGGRHVAFDVDPSERVSIRVAKDEAF